MSEKNQTLDPETIVRKAYAVAERMDLEGWKSLFADDGVFIDESVKITYKGKEPKGVDYPVRQYGTAFPDMHRELYNFWTVGNTVFVRLALQGTHGSARDSVWNPTSYWKADGCSVRRHLGIRERKDQEVRLLQRGFSDLGATRRHRESPRRPQPLGRISSARRACDCIRSPVGLHRPRRR